MRRASVVAGLAAAAGAALMLRRRQSRRRERVDLYYEDGSMISLEDRYPGAGRLLGLAHEALRVARA